MVVFPRNNIFRTPCICLLTKVERDSSFFVHYSQSQCWPRTGNSAQYTQKQSKCLHVLFVPRTAYVYYMFICLDTHYEEFWGTYQWCNKQLEKVSSWWWTKTTLCILVTYSCFADIKMISEIHKAQKWTFVKIIRHNF